MPVPEIEGGEEQAGAVFDAADEFLARLISPAASESDGLPLSW